MPSVLPQVRAGRFKGMAAGSAKRWQAVPASTTPSELAKFMRAEHERWKQVIKSGRIRIDG